MNFNKIHLKYKKTHSICSILLTMLIGIGIITLISSIVPILIRNNMTLSVIGSKMIIITTFIAIVIGIPKAIIEYRDGDFYGFYIGNDDDRIKYIKRITEEEYNFIQNVKDDYILGETIKEEDVNRARKIVKKRKDR